MEWNIFGIEYHRSTALRINHQLAENMLPPEVAKISPRETQFFYMTVTSVTPVTFGLFGDSSEECMIRLYTRLR